MLQRHLVCSALLAFVCLVLTSCGAPAALTPEQVHTQYVQALVNNDRQAVLNLTVREEQITVDRTLEQINEFKTGTGNFIWAKETQGNFIGAEPIGLADQGQGKVAVSVWRWEHTHDCLIVYLGQTDDGWKVTKWYYAADSQSEIYPQCAGTRTQ